jgi:cysteine desulfurase
VTTPVFLDNAASTEPDPAVLDVMAGVQRDLYANAASIHSAGVGAARAVERARILIAERLGGDTLVFTGGGTESNNLALKGAVWARGGGHLVISAIEHPSVTEPARWLEGTGQASLTVLPVDREGFVDPAAVEAALRPDTALVSIGHANSEVGTVQPIDAIGRLCRARGVLFHTDACQSFLREPLPLEHVDLVTVNAHKIHGPKGVGALWVRRGVKLAPLLHGGGHESGMRSGTLNAPAIAGFGEAVRRFDREAPERMKKLRDQLHAGFREAFPNGRIHGAPSARLCSNSNLGIPGVQGKRLLEELDKRGVRISTSSACHSTKLTPSFVLKAMGYTDEEAHEAIRLTLGRFTTARDIERVLGALVELARA